MMRQKKQRRVTHKRATRSHDGNFSTLKEWFTSLSSEQNRLLFEEMLKTRHEWREEIKPIKRIGLQYVYDQTIEDTLEFIAEMAFVLDMYLNRTGDYNLFMMLSKAPQNYWDIISRHVAWPDLFSEGSLTLLKDVDVKSINDPAVLLEAIAVFCEGIERIDIPKIYLFYCAGISKQAVQRLVMDFDRLNLDLARITDPQQLAGALVGKSMLMETMIKDYTDRLVGSGKSGLV